MEFSLFLHRPQPTLLTHSLSSIPLTGKRTFNRNSSVLPCRCSQSSSEATPKPAALSLRFEGRRALNLMGCFLAAAAGICFCDVAGAASTSRRALRGAKIPESEYTILPNGLKYYDLKVGNGAEAVKGSRVAVHYVAKWKNITFMTSRQGLGVGGGTSRSSVFFSWWVYACVRGSAGEEMFPAIEEDTTSNLMKQHDQLVGTLQSRLA